MPAMREASRTAAAIRATLMVGGAAGVELLLMLCIK